MSTETNPTTRLVGVTTATLVGTIAAILTVGLLTSFIVAGSISAGPEFAGMAVLAVVGLGLVMMHQGLSTETDSEDVMPQSIWLRLIIALVSIIYYNLVIGFTVALSIAASNAGLVAIAPAIAILYPIYDIRSVELGVPISIAGIFAVLVALILVPKFVAEEVNWSEIHIESALIKLISRNNGGPRKGSIS
ncbi:MAG: hypothetical protein ABEI86_10495 [Halobacteriaceae archaeon]